MAAPASQAAADAGTLTAADSNLIYEILTAEERRDASAAALAAGARHRDARVRHLSRRALARITDSTFAARDSLGRPSDRPFPSWPLPEWAERFRAITARTVGCDTLFTAVRDSAIQVRLRGIALAGNQAACRTHPEMLAALRGFIATMPSNASARRVPQGSWHEGAAALVSYALLAPDSAKQPSERFARHAMPQVRRAAARAAVARRDTALLRQLTRDEDGNVVEAAIEGLARVSGHADDSVFIAHLSDDIPQAALAAATALKGSTHAGTAPAARRALAEYQARNAASERDVRVALRALLGDNSPEPWALRQPAPLPREVIALALGEARYIEVISSRLHGGGAFTVELRGDIAPIMAARVLARVRESRYHGQRWHRVEPGFVIQGGSRWDNEYSGTEYFLVDELGTVPHPRGSVGMSTRGHDTGDAQWFINLRDNARLARDYTVFGAVVEGMDVVDRVLEGDQFYVMREVSAPRRPARP
jgi:cyclophilin family peptidyl-prolyl cis-trans isomerase